MTHKMNERQIIEKIKKHYLRKGWTDHAAGYMSACIYRDFFGDFKKKTSISRKIWAYKRGFSAETVYATGINDDNVSEYISERDYLKMEPHDPITKRLIDGKLVLPFTIGGRYPQYLPVYYAYINEYSQVIPLEGNCVHEFKNLTDYLEKILDQKSTVAIKSYTGKNGIGFLKLEKREGRYYGNSKVINDLSEIIPQINKKYLITEWIDQCETLSRIWNGSCATLRINVVNENGKPHVFFPMIRFGTSDSGTVANMAAGGFAVAIDWENGILSDTGYFYFGYSDRNYRCNVHPDTNKSFGGLKLPYFDRVIQLVNDICGFIPMHTYWGFDILISEKGPVICELNSEPAIVCLQIIFGGLWNIEDQYIKQYFKDRLMLAEGKRKR